MLCRRFPLQIVLLSILCHNGISSSPEPMHSIVLDAKGLYHVHWMIQDEEIVFKVEVQAKGYAGLGLSKNGAMAGSDMVTGWVDDGKAYFQDRHAVGLYPEVDEKQDWELITGYENDTHTILHFKRKLQTCDKDDMEIDESTIRLIYAFSHVDPPPGGDIQYHGDERGSRSVILVQPPPPKDTPTEDVLHWDLRVQNFTVPTKKASIYWCTVIRAPELNRTHHVIKIEPLIQPGNEKYVHHVVLYECVIGNSSEFERISQTAGHQCYHPNMPDEMRKCDAMMTAWGVGGEAVVFPENAGIPLRKAPPKYYLMETHYDNPSLHEGVMDSSGLRISYTPHLRKYDAGVLMIGASVTPRMFIPPHQPSFTVAGHSHPKCFDPAMKDGDIKLLGALLHEHVIGKQLKVRHFRGDVELPPLAENLYYDFNYQEYVMFNEEVIFKKGDQITVECTYDSSRLNETTFGGLFTDEEMCLAFILYYPRIERFGCLSVATFPLIKDQLGLNLDLSEGFNFNEYYDQMNKIDWDKVNISALEASMRYSPHDVHCYTGDGDKSSISDEISYPPNLTPFVKPNSCIDRNFLKFSDEFASSAGCGCEFSRWAYLALIVATFSIFLPR